MDNNIYKNWKISKWETPISNFGSSRMELLMDTDFLTIIIQEGAGDIRSRVKFIFRGDYAYRNINESFRNGLWAILPPRLGQTLKVEKSDLIEILRSDELGSDTFLSAKHYIILTEDDVIEVIAAVDPEIHELDQADPDAALPGKSIIRIKKEGGNADEIIGKE